MASKRRLLRGLLVDVLVASLCVPAVLSITATRPPEHPDMEMATYQGDVGRLAFIKTHDFIGGYTTSVTTTTQFGSDIEEDVSDPGSGPGAPARAVWSPNGEQIAYVFQSRRGLQQTRSA